ncbi:aminotransferase-like domain-containing protein [Musicola paradisiaca]|uniref:Transcriptional regulator, GntR family n=1 Tax=Musicola paradisiaca (strain Ech703) TaxID=579405 RepID=C6CCJ2_MUSP7|nr:PLP-dependent aminotransferase family protein [Musicola paradisiaca]ACS86835.1 putative transcriptional regulator, GntR family [Musicola paradisiaca Ech703]
MPLTVESSQLAYQDHADLNAMRFLNEVIERYPNAISFASGRPSKINAQPEKWSHYIALFSHYLADARHQSLPQVAALLGQYGDTRGIINALIAKQLLEDEAITLAPEEILITNGAQEGMVICLDTLFSPGHDVLLVTDPAYIGITGAARIKGIDVAYVECDSEGPLISALEYQVARIAADGKRARAVYTIPDFSNPCGTTLSLARRQALLTFCCAQGLLVLEDSPYRLFDYADLQLPTLFALDREAVVIHIGTFAKTLCPGVRIGYLACRTRVRQGDGSHPLIDEMTRVKSFISVNTGQIAQAIVGGFLLENGCSLKSVMLEVRNHYREKRDRLVEGLTNCFSDSNTGLSWNVPQGGFFLNLTVPCEITRQDIERCAEEFGVIVVPTAMFSNSNRYDNVLRLSFSYVELEQIDAGVHRLSRFIKELINTAQQTPFHRDNEDASFARAKE